MKIASTPHIWKSKILGMLCAIGVFTVLAATTLLAAPAAQAANPNSPPGFDEDVQCEWIADSYITCGRDAEFYFNLERSLATGSPIFRQKKDQNWVDSYLIFNNNGAAGVITNDLTKATPDVATEVSELRERERRSQRMWGTLGSDNRMVGDRADGPGNTKSGDNTYYLCGLESVEGERCFSGEGGFLQSALSKETADKIATWKENLDNIIAGEETCRQDAGALGFVFCPIVDALQQSMEFLIGDGTGNGGIFVKLLTIDLDPAQVPGLYAGWQGIRNVTLALYVLVFTLIVFGNGLGFDPYTIKRALPRLAAGVLLTFASYFIVQNMIELSNLVGTALPAFLATVADNANISNYSIPIGGLLVLGGATVFAGVGIILVIVLLLVVLFSVLIALFTMLLRIIIVYILVLLAPIAFLAWVLPNTEGLFKKWWSNFVKVLAMFPIITGLLSMSIFVSAVLASSNDGGNNANNVAVELAAIFAPVVALIMLPKTFKWGGTAFAATAGFVAGKLSNTAKKGGKMAYGAGKKAGQQKILSSDSPKWGANSRVGGFLTGAGVGSLMNTKGARLERMSAAERRKGEIEKGANRLFNHTMAEASGYAIEHGLDKDQTAKHKREKFAELIAKATPAERSAYATAAASSGNGDLAAIAGRAILGSGDAEGRRKYAEHVSNNYSSYDSMPEMRDADYALKKGNLIAAEAGMPGAPDVTTARAEFRTQVQETVAKHDSYKKLTDAKPPQQKEYFYTGAKDAAGNDVVDHAAVGSMNTTQIANMMQDKTSRGNLSGETAKAFDSYASSMERISAGTHTAEDMNIYNAEKARIMAGGKTEAEANAQIGNHVAAIRTGITAGGAFRP